MGPSFRSALPKFPVDDPHFRILARQRSRYTHYYFYIRDEVLGPIALCVGSFLPFSITYYLNGHSFIERELERAGSEFRKDDYAFLWVDSYTLTQLRYDLRKLKAHTLLQCVGHRYTYRLTDKGVRVALMFVLFHQRICGPLANSLFNRKPTQPHTPTTKLQAAYHRADASIQEVVDLLAA